jgi:hypothetical protein
MTNTKIKSLRGPAAGGWRTCANHPRRLQGTQLLFLTLSPSATTLNIACCEGVLRHGRTCANRPKRLQSTQIPSKTTRRRTWGRAQGSVAVPLCAIDHPRCARFANICGASFPEAAVATRRRTSARRLARQRRLTHCPGRNPPTPAVTRPPRPYRVAAERRFTAESATGA